MKFSGAPRQLYLFIEQYGQLRTVSEKSTKHTGQYKSFLILWYILRQNSDRKVWNCNGYNAFTPWVNLGHWSGLLYPSFDYWTRCRRRQMMKAPHYKDGRECRRKTHRCVAFGRFILRKRAQQAKWVLWDHPLLLRVHLSACIIIPCRRSDVTRVWVDQRSFICHF